MAQGLPQVLTGFRISHQSFQFRPAHALGTGTTRVFVVTEVDQAVVVAYYAWCLASVAIADLPERLRRGVFTSVPELIGAIDEYIAHHNTKPKPFIWTKSARDILQKVIRANSRLSSKQNATLH